MTTDAGPTLLLYDADCGFCTRCADWLAHRAPTSLSVVPWQGVDLERHDLTEDDVTEAAVWIDPDGSRLAGARAVAAALRAVGGGYRPLGRLLDLAPVRPLAGAVYRQVARHRHRLPGGTPTCKLG